eukprot:13265553-Alexandrium_andersonii.AAC.1
MNAVVAAESKRAMLRVRSEPGADLEAFFPLRDGSSTRTAATSSGPSPPSSARPSSSWAG